MRKTIDVVKLFFADVKNGFVSGVSSFFKADGFLKKFTFVYAVYFLGFLSILQANFLYKTDVQRVAMEVRKADWRHSGRFLNDLLVFIFHFDSYPQDISPLAQLIGIAFLTLSSLILVRMVAKKENYLALFLSVLLGLSPYFLQVFSYNFDCLFYSASVFFVIFPFLFYKDNKTFYVISLLGVLLAYMSWQASISIYMIVATYFFWRDFCSKEVPFMQLMKKIIITVVLFLFTSVFYVCLVHMIWIDHSVIALQGNFCELSKCKDVFLFNFKKATLGYFFLHWKNTPIGYAFLSVILLFCVYVLKFAMQKNKKMLPLTVLTSILCVCFMLFFIVLWTMFFPFIYWNARIWVGVGACFAVMMLAMTNEKSNILRKIMMIFCFALTWGCIVFAARVGNLMDIQKRYETFVFTTLSQDLTQFPEVKKVIFKHRKIHSPVIKVHAEQYPLLKDIVSGLQTQYFRFKAHFFDFYRPDLSVCDNWKEEYHKVLLKNAHHKFTQINDNCVKIDLK